MAGLERPDRRLRFELKALALVASGAVPGALVRWQLVERLGPQLGGPWGANLLANLVGCFLLGFLSGPLPSRTPLMLVLGIGFCGSLTTFSGWILDLASFQHQGQGLGGLALVLTSLGLGLLAALGGRAFSRRLFGGRQPQI
jgi:CrcB protein